MQFAPSKDPGRMSAAAEASGRADAPLRAPARPAFLAGDRGWACRWPRGAAPHAPDARNERAGPGADQGRRERNRRLHESVPVARSDGAGAPRCPRSPLPPADASPSLPRHRTSPRGTLPFFLSFTPPLPHLDLAPTLARYFCHGPIICDQDTERERRRQSCRRTRPIRMPPSSGGRPRMTDSARARRAGADPSDLGRATNRSEAAWPRGWNVRGDAFRCRLRPQIAGCGTATIAPGSRNWPRFVSRPRRALSGADRSRSDARQRISQRSGQRVGPRWPLLYSSAAAASRLHQPPPASPAPPPPLPNVCRACGAPGRAPRWAPVARHGWRPWAAKGPSKRRAGDFGAGTSASLAGAAGAWPGRVSCRCRRSWCRQNGPFLRQPARDPRRPGRDGDAPNPMLFPAQPLTHALRPWTPDAERWGTGSESTDRRGLQRPARARVGSPPATRGSAPATRAHTPPRPLPAGPRREVPGPVCGALWR